MKLAIIALSTFGYFERMAVRISNRGVPATFFDERPRNDVFSKLKYRLLPKAVGRRIAADHVRGICTQIVENGYTHALVVFAEVLSKDDIGYLKAAGVKVSRFTWDSVKNRPDVRRLDSLFDRIGSFDPADCETYGYSYIPLYSETIEPELVLPIDKRNLDFFFCGTMHSNRPELIHDISECIKRRGWSVKLSLFFHSRWLYAIRNLFSVKAMRLFPLIADRPFPHDETLADSRNARVVIDIQHPNQVGLTMRTFEALAQGAVLATTNERALTLLDQRFPGRIVYLDPATIEESLERAIEARPEPLGAEQYHELSQERFIDQILDLIGIDPQTVFQKTSGGEPGVGSQSKAEDRV